MKIKHSVIVIFLFTLNGCKESSIVPLIGDWKLIAISTNENNNSFTSVNSDKILTFKDDQTFECNVNLLDEKIKSGCQNGSYSTENQTVYIKECFSIAGIAIPTGFQYEINSSGNLIVSLNCQEFCIEKYKKL